MARHVLRRPVSLYAVMSKHFYYYSMLGGMRGVLQQVRPSTPGEQAWAQDACPRNVLRCDAYLLILWMHPRPLQHLPYLGVVGVLVAFPSSLSRYAYWSVRSKYILIMPTATRAGSMAASCTQRRSVSLSSLSSSRSASIMNLRCALCTRVRAMFAQLQRFHSTSRNRGLKLMPHYRS